MRTGLRVYVRRVEIPGPDASYGERLKWALTMRGRSQRWLAAEVGTDPGRVNAWCKSKNGPQARYRVPVAEALGAEVGWLTTGAGLPWPEAAGPRSEDPAVQRLERKLDAYIAERGEINRDDVLDLLREALARGADRRDEPGSGAAGARRGQQ